MMQRLVIEEIPVAELMLCSGNTYLVPKLASQASYFQPPFFFVSPACRGATERTCFGGGGAAGGVVLMSSQRHAPA